VAGAVAGGLRIVMVDGRLEYRYELHRSEELLATGHLSREEPLGGGERLEIGGKPGIVRTIDPVRLHDPGRRDTGRRARRAVRQQTARLRLLSTLGTRSRRPPLAALVRRGAGVGIAAAGVYALPAAALASTRLARALGLETRLADGGAVALTFDDGPHPEGTPAVLELLARLDAKATFFLSGEQVVRYPGMARAVVEQGHAVGVHGYRHVLLALRTPGATSADLHRAVAVIAEATEVAPRLYRPPYGAASAAVVAAARRAGLRTVLWSRWGRDWEQRATPASVAANAAENLRGGEIVLLHDADHYAVPGCWRATAAALPAIASAVERAGLSFRTL
jgi:peptidoglycan-N-acetylglucosamine deacetylase